MRACVLVCASKSHCTHDGCIRTFVAAVVLQTSVSDGQHATPAKAPMTLKLISKPRLVGDEYGNANPCDGSTLQMTSCVAILHLFDTFFCRSLATCRQWSKC